MNQIICKDENNYAQAYDAAIRKKRNFFPVNKSTRYMKKRQIRASDNIWI